MRRTINVGLVGFGMAARVFHAPLIHASSRARLTHVVKRSGSGSGEASLERYPAARVLRKLDDLLQDPAVELVVVATPNHTHFPIAAAALAAGKHVVVDKPFTMTSSEADDLIALARSQQRLLSVFHNRRWDGDFQTVRQILEQKILGRIVEYESHFDRYRPTVNPEAWREAGGAGAGIVYDLGSHLIDQALLLFGWPQRLFADIRRQRDGAQADDSFELILDCPGVKVTLKAGMLVREPGPRFIVHGTQGSYAKHGLDPQEDALKRGSTPADAGWGVEPEENWGTLTLDMNAAKARTKFRTLPGCYPAFYDNVCAAILGEKPPAVTAEQARDVIRLIELAYRSSAEGKWVCC